MGLKGPPFLTPPLEKCMVDGSKHELLMVDEKKIIQSKCTGRMTKWWMAESTRYKECGNEG